MMIYLLADLCAVMLVEQSMDSLTVRLDDMLVDLKVVTSVAQYLVLKVLMSVHSFAVQAVDI